MASISLKPQIPRINWNNPITKGLVLDIPMFERGGLNTLDIVSKKGGVLTNSPTWISDVIGPGISFTTTSNMYVNLGWNPTRVTQNWAMEAMIKPILPQVTGMVIYMGDDSAGYGMGVGATSDGSGSKFIALFSAVAWIDPGIDLTNGALIHLVLTNVSGTTNFYVNGLLAGSYSDNNPSAPTVNVSSLAKEIGGAGNRSLNGKMFYGRVWKRSLSASEVKQLYTNPWQIYIKPKVDF